MSPRLEPRVLLFLMSLLVSIGLYILRGVQILTFLPGWFFLGAFGFTMILGLLATQRPRHWS